jgi:Domain of unknown function (DUF4149)
MNILGKILRTLSLAILFGGSAAVVFSAIVLVKAAQAKGIPVPQAAAANAPVFIHYAKVNLGAGILLLVGEALDYAKRGAWTKLTIAQYACSLLCVATTMIFAFYFAPTMAELLPNIKDAAVQTQFHQLHEGSRAVFGGTILLALASLILPIFGALQPGTPPSKTAESA